jgi:hypothetical protein
VSAALARGALHWIYLYAPKRAVWDCFQVARMLTPPPELPDREGVFSAVCPPSHHASHNEATTSQPSRRGVGVLSFSRSPPPLAETSAGTSVWIRSVPPCPMPLDLIDCLPSSESHPDTSGFKYDWCASIQLDNLTLSQLYQWRAGAAAAQIRDGETEADCGGELRDLPQDRTHKAPAQRLGLSLFLRQFSLPTA